MIAKKLIVKDEPFVMRICWGSFDETGKWSANNLLNKTKEEQALDNFKNGFLTAHRHLKR